MNDTAVLVVGSGLSGLLSAVFAARRGKSVRLLYRGQGAVGIGGGSLDVLGYVPGAGAGAVAEPLKELEKLPAEHPYRLIGGAPMVSEALEAFLSLTAELGYPHHVRREGGQVCNTALLTCAGTMKPSCIVPPSMTMEGLREERDIFVVGFDGLKDFHPRLMVQGFSRLKLLAGRHMTPVHLPCPPDLELGAGQGRLRDMATTDLARYVETPRGFAWLCERLKAARPAGSPDAVFLLPPVLGLVPTPNIHARLEEALGCRVHEVLAPPPAVTGLRLRTLLQSELRRLGVSVVANATVTGAEVKDGVCAALYTDMGGRTLRWTADSFIIATGGIYGEGLIVSPDSVTDAIFKDAIALRPDLTPSHPQWSAPEAYPSICAGQGHGFARLGAVVNSRLQPLSPSGSPLCANVFYPGRALGGYDYAAEKSGNGVALVSAFFAAAE